MALYRKYRPATFAEVVGQEHVTDPLSIALDTGRISHAYLFSGPRGCGKTSSARILARSLNCVDGPTSTPCGTCASCVALGPGGSGNLDVIELDAASHGGVDDTRELRDRAFYAPAESRYRVFIVDEAHMVTTAGFNALLKIVEEPPAHLIFIFATTEPDKVLPTIRSRTHHYPFRLLPPATMRGLLGKICEQENVPVEEAVYPLVIRAGGGSPRDSLSVLDQLLAGAGPDGVTYPRAVALLGVTDVALIDNAVDALATDDGAALFGTIDQVMEAGHDPRRFAVDLLERLRDLILMRAVPDAVDRGLVAGPGDVLDRMRDQAGRIGPATLTRYAELLHEGLGEMRGATAPRLLLEVICARMLLPSVSDTESATLQRLERLERGFAGGAVPPARPVSASNDTPAERPAPRSAPPASGGGRPRGAELLAAALAEKDAATRPPTPAPPRDAQAAMPPSPGAGPTTQSPSPPSAAPSAPTAQSPAAGSSGPRSASASSAAERSAQVAPAAAGSSAPVDRSAQTAPAAAVPVVPADAAAPTAAAPTAAAAPPAAAAPVARSTPSAGGPAAPVAESEATVTAPPTAGSSAAPSAPSGRGAAPAGEPSAETAAPADAPPVQAAPPEVAASAPRNEQGDTAISEKVAAQPTSVGEIAPPTVDPRASTVEPSAVQGDSRNRVTPDRRPTAPDGTAPTQTEARVGTAPEPSAPATQPSTGGSAAPVEDLLGVVEAAWPEIKGKVREFGATLQALLSGAAVSRVDGGVVVFAHQSPPLAQRLSDPRNIDAVRSAVRAVLGRELDVRWETGMPAPRPAPVVKGSGAPARGPGEDKPAARPRFSRPSQAKGNQGRPSGQSGPGEDDIPPPDFPDLPDDPGPEESYGPDSGRSGGEPGRAGKPGGGVPAPPTPEEEQEMLAAAAEPVAPGDRQDPDEVALALLRDELGAKSLDG
ncbi:DNA polymerase III subunit gamma/tau [Nocardia mangyaensis]|uniref:DNA polymerase III subunit gamma/tau n=1 Tax=Nocardia mangyaensis TaxID=2213200 RepID=A0A1J0VL97_9NOCA|nr:DNA polymerase III subunit gamma and tau [Nocardia mangyaensis]APE32820.1 DNA polymerase III subunit gamma/tau [Nocardia mangyaensis]